jgi:hypothetical protein
MSKNNNGTRSVHVSCAPASDVFHEHLEGFRARYPNKGMHVASVAVTENIGETPKLTLVIEAADPSLLHAHRPRYIALLYSDALATESIQRDLKYLITDALIFDVDCELVRLHVHTSDFIQGKNEGVPPAYIWSYLDPAEFLHACMSGRNFNITVERVPDVGLDDWNGISTECVESSRVLCDVNGKPKHMMCVRVAKISHGHHSSFGFVDRHRFRVSLDHGHNWSKVFSLPYSFDDAFAKAGNTTVIHFGHNNNILRGSC